MKKLFPLIIASFSFVLIHCSSDSIAPAPATTLPVNVTVKLAVGDFLYENLEAVITVNGYDAQGNVKWTNDFPFTGPEGTLVIPNGFDHYSLSTTKWGVSDSQTITAQQLQDTRANGPAPVTYGLGGTVTNIKKPAFSVDYAQNGTEFPVQSKTEYEYDIAGNIKRATTYDYSSQTSTYTASQYSTFTFDGKRVSVIKQYTATDDQLSLRDDYQYGVDGELLKITESNYSAGTTGTMNFAFDAQQQGNAIYAFSNGSGFTYQFSYALKNITSDKTTKGAQLCNQGTYTHDKNINPFKHLGYVSFVLNNYSVNNTLTEDVAFSGCSYPELVPESYTYKYDDDGYPTEKTTHYKGRSEVTVTKYYYTSFPN